MPDLWLWVSVGTAVKAGSSVFIIVKMLGRKLMKRHENGSNRGGQGPTCSVSSADGDVDIIVPRVRTTHA